MGASRRSLIGNVLKQLDHILASQLVKQKNSCANSQRELFNERQKSRIGAQSVTNNHFVLNKQLGFKWMEWAIQHQ